MRREDGYQESRTRFVAEFRRMGMLVPPMMDGLPDECVRVVLRLEAGERRVAVFGRLSIPAAAFSGRSPKLRGFPQAPRGALLWRMNNNRWLRVGYAPWLRTQGRLPRISCGSGADKIHWI